MVFGVEIDTAAGAEWSLPQFLLFTVALLSGLLCGFLGFAIGVGVDVKDEKNNFVITVLWHYMANGVLIWGLLLTMVFSKLFTEAEMRQQIVEWGVRKTTTNVFLPSISCSLAIAGLLLATGGIKMGKRSLNAVPILRAILYWVDFFLSV